MATTTFTARQDWDSGTDQVFRDFINGVGDFLEANGMPRTADSGQFDRLTVARPVGTPIDSLSPVYEIRRFSDALQATAPVFVKIRWGLFQFSGTSAAAAMHMQVGTSTDGAGNLTGRVSSFFEGTYQFTTGIASTLFTSYLSVGPSRLQMCLWPGVFQSGGSPSDQQTIINIERLRGDDGLETADGVFVHACKAAGGNGFSQAQQPLQQVIPFDGFTPIPTSIPVPVAMVTQNGANSAVWGGKAGVFPIFPHRGRLLNPAIGEFVVLSTDLSAGSTFSLSPYGIRRTYRVMPAISGGYASGYTAALPTVGAPTAASRLIALLWE